MSAPPPETPEGFGPALRLLRSAAGLTQRQVGEVVGLTAPTISSFESGRVFLEWSRVVRYLRAVGQDPEAWSVVYDRVAAMRDSEPAAGVEGIGPTGRRVAGRVAELRHERELTLAGLEARLASVGRPIQLSSISKIEQGQRRVDVDDLVALALAFDVSPNMLLLGDDLGDADVPLTASQQLSSASAWSWAVRDVPASPFELGTAPQTDIDFFVSHAGADTPWADWIATTLESAGFRIWFGERHIRLGDNIVTSVTEGLRRSRRLVAVLSPLAAQSHWAAAEMMAAVARNDASPRSSSTVLPVRVADGPIPAPFRDRRCLSLIGLGEDTARERLLEAAASLGSRIPPHVPPAFPGPTS